MKAVEASAKTREEAIQKALQDLGVEMYEVDKIEIVDEGSRGLFGFGARPVRVRLIVERLHEEPQRRDSRPSGGRDGGREARPESRPEARPERGQQERGRGARGGRDRNEPARPEAGRGAREARPERTERPAREEKSDRHDRSARAARPARAERPAPAERSPRPEAAPASGTAQPAAPAAPGERPEGGERGERGRRRRGGRGRGGSREEGASSPAQEGALVEERELTGAAVTPERVKPHPEPRAPEEPSAPISDEQGQEAAALLQQMIEKMGIDATVAFLRGEEGGARLNVESEDGALLIGRKGRNLSAMQYLVNRMISRGDTAENTERLVVDVEGYVDRRRQSLEELALEEAARAKESGRTVRLKPMSPWERRIIHLTLQDNADVRTFSLGEALYRSVVISPKDGEQPERGAGRAAREGGRSGGRGGRGGRGGEPRSDARPEPRPETRRDGRGASRAPVELDDINDEIETPRGARREPSILAMKPVRPIRAGQRPAAAAEETASEVTDAPATTDAPVASSGPRGAQSRRRPRGQSQHETDYDAGALGD